MNSRSTRSRSSRIGSKMWANSRGDWDFCKASLTRVNSTTGPAECQRDDGKTSDGRVDARAESSGYVKQSRGIPRCLGGKHFRRLAHRLADDLAHPRDPA